MKKRLLLSRNKTSCISSGERPDIKHNWFCCLSIGKICVISVFLLSLIVVALASFYISKRYFTVTTTIVMNDGGDILSIEKERGNYSINKYYSRSITTIKRKRNYGELIEEKRFYLTGQLRYICSDFNDGVPSGIVKAFFPDGTIMFKVNHNKQGDMEGKCYLYHSNGTLIVEANYVHGKLEREFKSFYPDGTSLGNGIMKNNAPWEGTFSALSMNPYIGGIKDDYLKVYREGKLIKSTQLERPFESNWPIDDEIFSFFNFEE